MSSLERLFTRFERDGYTPDEVAEALEAYFERESHG